MVDYDIKEYINGVTIKNALGMTEDEFLDEMRTEAAVMRMALIRRAHEKGLENYGIQYPPDTFLLK